MNKLRRKILFFESLLHSFAPPRGSMGGERGVVVLWLGCVVEVGELIEELLVCVESG